MRHNVKKFQLNRFTSWHKATVISMARNLIIHQRIKTSLQKAKAARHLLEKLITLAKDNTLAAKRAAAKILNDHKLVRMLFNEIGPRFAKRTGGYTRIVNLGKRRGDDAAMVIWELTEIKEKKVKKPKKGKAEEVATEEKAPETQTPPAQQKPEAHGAFDKEKHPADKKPPKKFLGGIRNIFKKERDSL